jgi:sulfite oxidase
MATMDYSGEPPHSELLFVQASQPFNAEPPTSALVEFDLTPEDLVYCRNHGPVREFDEETYSISIKGGVDRELTLTVSELKSMFPLVQVVAVLQVRPLDVSPSYRWGSNASSVCWKQTE